jgi:hypothetical protein
MSEVDLSAIDYADAKSLMTLEEDKFYLSKMAQKLGKPQWQAHMAKPQDLADFIAENYGESYPDGDMMWHHKKNEWTLKEGGEAPPKEKEDKQEGKTKSGPPKGTVTGKGKKTDKPKVSPPKGVAKTKQKKAEETAVSGCQFDDEVLGEILTRLESVEGAVDAVGKMCEKVIEKVEETGGPENVDDELAEIKWAIGVLLTLQTGEGTDNPMDCADTLEVWKEKFFEGE